MFDLEFFRLFAAEEKSFFLAGTDEVGRGPLAGPVVGACSFFEMTKYDEKEIKALLKKLRLLGINDSKKLNAKKRQEIIQSFINEKTLLSHQIYSIQISKNIQIKIYIQEIDSSTIDEINILQASLLAMKTAFLNNLGEVEKGVVLIDGNKKFKLEKKFDNSITIHPIVKGDSQSLLIGLASIFAKEYRDQLMSSFAQEYPEYGWDSNAGYPTKAHLDAIEAHGVTKLHRVTFKGAKEVYEQRGITRG